MTAIWALTAQAIMISIAYPSATLAAAAFAAIVPGDPALPDIVASVRVATAVLAAIAELWWDALVTAFWPTLVVALLFEGMKVRGLLPHLVAGCCVGLVRAYSVGAFLGGEIAPVDTFPAQLSVAAGALGGLVYWVIAGRTAGRWLELRWFEPQGR